MKLQCVQEVHYYNTEFVRKNNEEIEELKRLGEWRDIMRMRERHQPQRNMTGWDL